VSYKDNEIFLCDGNASFIVLPEYWTTPRLQNYVTYLLLLAELLNSQLSYIQALADSLETGIISQSLAQRRPQAIDYHQAALMKGLILLMEKSGDIGSLVSHGFSRKYLEQVRDELNIPDRTQAVYRRMRIVDERLTLQSEREVASRGLSLNTTGVRIAIIALLMTVLLQICQLLIELFPLVQNGSFSNAR
jgi:hypothetical protein